MKNNFLLFEEDEHSNNAQSQIRINDNPKSKLRSRSTRNSPFKKPQQNAFGSNSRRHQQFDLDIPTLTTFQKGSMTSRISIGFQNPKITQIKNKSIVGREDENEIKQIKIKKDNKDEKKPNSDKKARKRMHRIEIQEPIQQISLINNKLASKINRPVKQATQNVKIQQQQKQKEIVAKQIKLQPKIQKKNINNQTQEKNIYFTVQQHQFLEQNKKQNDEIKQKQVEQHHKPEVKAKQQEMSYMQSQRQAGYVLKNSPADHTLTQLTIHHMKNKKAFLTTPIPQGCVLRCVIKRDKSWLKLLYPQFHVYLSREYKHLMSAKKRTGTSTSNYIMSSDPIDFDTSSNNYLGKVKSNFMGTQFLIFDNGCNPKRGDPNKQVRQMIGSVYYTNNLFKSMSPRQIEVYIPKPPEIYYEQNVLGKIDLKQMYEKNKQKIIAFKNKPLVYIEDQNVYIANYFGRVSIGSVKNFILDYIGTKNDEFQYNLLFGKSSNEIYNVDVRYPLSPLQAFGIILSSFDHKIACT